VEGQAGKITCPACQSVVSSDGKTLHKKSEYLSDLIENEDGLPKLAKEIDRLETTIARLKEDLKTEKEKAATPPAKGKENVEAVRQTEAGAGGSSQPTPRKRWW
jgi:uncharacterized protein Yka (UPF0111/DUF47 family)